MNTTPNEALENIIKACEFEYKPPKGPFQLIDKVEWYKKHVAGIKEIAEQGKGGRFTPTIFVPAGLNLTSTQFVCLGGCCSCAPVQEGGSGGSGPGSLQEP